MSVPIEPAKLEFTPDGTPWSSRFGDVYHSQDGGLGQSRHVFLGGNHLPARWQGRERFVIVETGFGLGLNFLTTWAAWREDPARCDRLHFISIEKHPFNADDLARAHARWPELNGLATRLREHWPALTPGMHRLWLEDGRVALTLVFGDASRALEQLSARADAFYLDGFSPARNPALWSARLCHQLAAIANPGATLATWSVAGEVRRQLRIRALGDRAHARLWRQAANAACAFCRKKYRGAAAGSAKPSFSAPDWRAPAWRIGWRCAAGRFG